MLIKQIPELAEREAEMKPPAGGPGGRGPCAEAAAADADALPPADTDSPSKATVDEHVTEGGSHWPFTHFKWT